MRKIFVTIIALLVAALMIGCSNPYENKIVIELNPEKAPQTVANFLEYSKSGHYEGTIFHRVIAEFMIQGGGFTPELEKKPTKDPIKNEADNGLSNKRGTIAMARTGDPHSASAQFFINVVDNDRLDHKDKTNNGWGYCVFGKVVEGMDVVDRIREVDVSTKKGMQNVPVNPVVIKAVKVNGNTVTFGIEFK